ncbi:hypothetical protein PCE1_003267 [Barthelona sp. PCE]
MKIGFLHPDLGIGGAERLVCDCALALKDEGHDVTIVTAHHEPTHCFPETVDGRIPVKVYGDWMPRHILRRLYAFFAYLRMIYCAIVMCIFHKYDLIIVDQVSIPVPLLKWKFKKVIFYCHFPDKLLCTNRSFIKRIYRAPLDWLEEKTTGAANVILVNSEFTLQTFKKHFPSITKEPKVLYPTFFIDTEAVQTADTSVLDAELLEPDTPILLSINRFERKKNIMLALEAFNSVADTYPRAKLVLAGGYDVRVHENVEVHAELVEKTKEYDLEDRVFFYKSFSNEAKNALLKTAHILIYTPDNEHFGIVPLEAMASGVPVLAANTGGPLETVHPMKTGLLSDTDVETFSRSLDTLMSMFSNENIYKEFAFSCVERVQNLFSFESFQERLATEVDELYSLE